MTAESSTTSTASNENSTQAVFRMLLQGLSREQIVAWVRSEKNETGLTEAGLPGALAVARDRLGEYAHFQHQDELGKTLARLDDLYAKSYQIQDYKTCHAIERERTKLLTANRSSAPEPPTPAPATDEPWIPLVEAARKLGFKAVRALQLWCTGRNPAHQPPLPHKQKGRAYLVQLEPARRHLLKHAKRLPPSFPRAGMAPTNPVAVQTPALDSEADALDEIRSAKELLAEILRNPEITETAAPQMLNALASVDTALLRREQAEEKSRGLVPKADVRRMLQFAGKVYVEKITQDLAPSAARNVLRMVRESLDTDLAALNSDAVRFAEAEIRAAAQTTLEAIQREIDDRCAGLAKLDFDPSNPSSGGHP